VTLVHELTHAWTAELGLIDGWSEPVIEGFCEYVALQFIERYLLADGLQQQMAAVRGRAERIETAMLGSQDVVYGKGLRWVRKQISESAQPPITWLRTAKRTEVDDSAEPKA
jgi:hypothetical protein